MPRPCPCLASPSPSLPSPLHSIHTPACHPPRPFIPFLFLSPSSAFSPLHLYSLSSLLLQPLTHFLFIPFSFSLVPIFSPLRHSLLPLSVFYLFFLSQLYPFLSFVPRFLYLQLFHQVYFLLLFYSHPHVTPYTSLLLFFTPSPSSLSPLYSLSSHYLFLHAPPFSLFPPLYLPSMTPFTPPASYLHLAHLLSLPVQIFPL